MKKLKSFLLLLVLSSAWTYHPVLAQEQRIDSNAELSLRKKELENHRKELCDYLSTLPRTYYLSSKSKGSFSDYARNFDKLLDTKLSKTPIAQSGYVTFSVRISSTGDLNSLEVNHSDGSEDLPELVKRLIQTSAPFPKFSPNMASVANEVFFVRTVQSKGFRVPSTSKQAVSAEEVKELTERLKELTERSNKLYKENCLSSN